MLLFEKKTKTDKNWSAFSKNKVDYLLNDAAQNIFQKNIHTTSSFCKTLRKNSECNKFSNLIHLSIFTGLNFIKTR